MKTILRRHGLSILTFLAFMYYEPDLPNRFLDGDPDYVHQTNRGRAQRISGLVLQSLDAIAQGWERVWLAVVLDHNVEYQESRLSEFDSISKRVSAQDVGGIDPLLYEVGR